MLIEASKKYREAKVTLESEMRAPRKVIGWLILLGFIQLCMSSVIMWKLFGG